MLDLDYTFDTEKFEAQTELDENRCLTDKCVTQASDILDKYGFVIIPDLLSSKEADQGMRIIKESINNPNREKGTFASQTDIKYKRRDFCPLPSNNQVLSYSAMLCNRLEHVINKQCSQTSNILEISTLTTYLGASHQYIHSDPDNVLCMFAAVEDVTTEQGGTVFIPSTHGDTKENKLRQYMSLYKTFCNLGIFRYNLSRLIPAKNQIKPKISWKEFQKRVFSFNYDNHQPNILRFITGKNPVFSISHLSPRALIYLIMNFKQIKEDFYTVKTTLKKGSVILYRSEMLHAGPDNQSKKPRFFFSMSIARSPLTTKEWRGGYSPHSTLLDNPKMLGDLLARQI